jgi:acyl CoA:acetate/3-ketoacid CoA transferase alpha subunit
VEDGRGCKAKVWSRVRAGTGVYHGGWCADRAPMRVVGAIAERAPRRTIVFDQCPICAFPIAGALL